MCGSFWGYPSQGLMLGSGYPGPRLGCFFLGSSDRRARTASTQRTEGAWPVANEDLLRSFHDSSLHYRT